MKLKNVSDELSQVIASLEWTKRKNHYVARTTERISKPVEKELKNLAVSFGGATGVLHEYMFLYDAKNDLDMAVKYGYYYGVCDNICYLPPNIIDSMCNLAAKYNNGNILIPFAGYGNICHSLNDKYPDAYKITCENEHFLEAIKLLYDHIWISQNNKTVDELIFTFDCILLRSQLNNFKYIQKCIGKLNLGGTLITLIYSDAIYTSKKPNLVLKNSHLYNINIIQLAENKIDLNGDKEVSIVVIERKTHE
jgi:hypothetical protein